MALNYATNLIAYEEDGVTAIPDVKVHLYFLKVNSNSSASKWDSNIRRTNPAGATSINLGDASLLTSDGKADTNDIILVTAWLTDNVSQTNDKSSKEANKILRCVNFIHTVNTSSSTWTERFILPRVKSPTCNINFPLSTLTGHPFTIANTSTVNEGPFNYNIGNVNRSDLYQNFRKYSQNLFLGREIKETSYDLDEVSSIKTTTENFTYSWVDSGVYNTIVRVYNHLGYYCEKLNSYTIRYNKPTIAFDYSFTKLLNSSKYIGVGNDDLMFTKQLSSTNFGDSWTQIKATFDWNISDLKQGGANNSDNYLLQNELFEPKKYFLSEGFKEIVLKINWNDGFNDFTEVLTKTPFLDIYNIGLDFNWTTRKNYLVDTIPIPLGDDDLVKIHNLSKDIAKQNYNSTTQFNNLNYYITKNKNDGTPDNEEFLYNKVDNIFNEIPEFFIRFLHDTIPAKVQQDINYWDGYKNVDKTLIQYINTEKYRIQHKFHWNTDFYGLNKVVTRDDDGVTITNTSTFNPQNNQDIVINSEYLINKDRYVSYTDINIIPDNEYFIYDNLVDKPKFFIRKEGISTVTNIITYYDGYKIDTSTLAKNIISELQIPNPKFTWDSRYGNETYIEGRDDLVVFSQSSTLLDFYNTEHSITNTRHLGIDWFIHNKITKNNYNNSSLIGGPVFSDNSNNIDEFLFKDISFKPNINYWTALNKQIVKIIFYYNNGFYNTSIDLSKNIETRPYLDLIPGATYTNHVPDRHTIIKFKDNSNQNQNRIISTDWSLTDRYENNSMSYLLQGTDNLQTWLNIPRLVENSTKVNSQENHILSQDEIRWDDGFKLKLFDNNYTITTSKYSINPMFDYKQKYNTGPEIQFWNTTTNNGLSKQLGYELLLSDKDNDGIDTTTEYLDLVKNYIQEHIYKSVSNSPFELDLYNKLVIITVWFDDGWNEVYDDYSSNILVKPNRINQDFLVDAIRHPSDIGTDRYTIVGNNPFEFYDNSTTERINDLGELDYNFIDKVKYNIEDICN